MVEQICWRQRSTVLAALVIVALGAQGCAVAYAQTGPDAGASGSSATTSADGGSASNTAPAAEYSGPPPYFNLRPPQVRPGLTADQIRAVFRREHNALQNQLIACYTRVLAGNPRAHGVVTTRMTVLAGGFMTVDRISAAPANEPMTQCMQEALSNAQWPVPRGQPTVEVTLTMDLAPTPPATGRR